jgi:stearoyl-CoA desaturase (delta-9 desaturase)
VNLVERARARRWHEVYFNSASLFFWFVHAGAAAGVIALGWSWPGFALAVALYAVRMFFVTGGYHRYFSHRSYKTSRWFQLVLAIGATSTAQKGVLWWAHHHRHHHRASDEPDDLHSPVQGGFWWSHVGWILCRDFEATDPNRIKDFARYPELVWLNRHYWLPPVALAGLLYAVGGLWALVWGFAVSTVILWHLTFTINSLSHVVGRRRYATTDDSRNQWLLGFLTLGEGWHNNHHHYQVAARQGFYWWEVDLTFYALKALAAVGIVWELHGVPDHIRDRRPVSVADDLDDGAIGVGGDAEPA